MPQTKLKDSWLASICKQNFLFRVILKNVKIKTNKCFRLKSEEMYHLLCSWNKLQHNSREGI